MRWKNDHENKITDALLIQEDKSHTSNEHAIAMVSTEILQHIQCENCNSLQSREI
jgi:hypothetical protein